MKAQPRPRGVYRALRPDVGRQRAEGLVNALRNFTVPLLTEREQAVLKGVFDGLTNKGIALRVHISEALVKSTLQRLFEKTGVRTRSQLLRIALQHSNQL